MRKARGNRNWVRGFDWDYADFTATLPQGDFAVEWLRVPSDQIDPLSGILMHPKTLTRLLLFPTFIIEALPAINPATLYFGVMRWTDYDATIGSFGDIPDPRNGALDWVAWLSLPVANPNVTLSNWERWHSTYLYGSDKGCLDFASQRKLPSMNGLIWVAYLEAPIGCYATLNFQARIGLKGDVTASGLGGG